MHRLASRKYVRLNADCQTAHLFSTGGEGEIGIGKFPTELLVGYPALRHAGLQCLLNAGDTDCVGVALLVVKSWFREFGDCLSWASTSVPFLAIERKSTSTHRNFFLANQAVSDLENNRYLSLSDMGRRTELWCWLLFFFGDYAARQYHVTPLKLLAAVCSQPFRGPDDSAMRCIDPATGLGTLHGMVRLQKTMILQRFGAGKYVHAALDKAFEDILDIDHLSMVDIDKLTAIAVADPTRKNGVSLSMHRLSLQSLIGQHFRATYHELVYGMAQYGNTPPAGFSKKVHPGFILADSQKPATPSNIVVDFSPDLTALPSSLSSNHPVVVAALAEMKEHAVQAKKRKSHSKVAVKVIDLASDGGGGGGDGGGDGGGGGEEKTEEAARVPPRKIAFSKKRARKSPKKDTRKRGDSSLGTRAAKTSVNATARGGATRRAQVAVKAQVSLLLWVSSDRIHNDPVICSCMF